MFTKHIGHGYGNLGFENWYRVNPSTICRCTGREDKSGKLIWENDIVKINNSKVNTVIAFRNFEIICTIPNEKYYKHRLEYDTEYEVIGNTFDNPELLESEE
uniref:YopX protein n=1 Tax=Siphoviridae sp. ctNLX12 TaxID=2825469 RepID=A0A8S5UDJ6_9CAUD|nr:MAG TPA: YopX protein [Siphoviridae sp. ctNLX12]